MKAALLTTTALCIFATPVLAQEQFGAAPMREALKPRVQLGLMAGNERTIGTTSFWMPLYQNLQQGSVVYGDYRFSADNGDNSEFNIGLGYRQMLQDTDLLGDGVTGVHGWFDRRSTKRGSNFNQITLGAEWFGKNWDFKVNGYVPLNEHKDHIQSNPNGYGASFSGTQLVVNTDQSVREEAMKGGDIEVGFRLPYMDEYTDSTRIYGAYYHFEGDRAEGVNGWRTRVRSDVNEDVTLGFRYQHDDVRGSQGFLELSIAFPFGNKKSYQKSGLWARMDESPERDIDIVSNEVITDDGMNKPVTSTASGVALEVIHVDNTNTSGTEDGSAESPYNTLAEAAAAASANSVIYVTSGDGTSTGMNAGITLSKSGQKLIGSGVALTTDLLGITLPEGSGFNDSATTLIAAGTAPTLANAAGAVVTLSANNATVSGVVVDGTAGGSAYDGIVVEADGAAASAVGVSINNVTAQNNRMGIYLHATNSGSVSAKVENAVTTSNAWHGIAVYDDTDGTFEADLGGGALGSRGNNVLAANTLEDLAVDYDGRQLSAANNWWGQATGADQDDPSDGVDPQIYYGAPINEGLALHLTFDEEWTTATTAYDRSGQNNDGAMRGGISLSDQVTGSNGEGLFFAGNGEQVRVTTDNGITDRTQLTTLVSFNTTDVSASLLTKISTHFHNVITATGRSHIQFIPAGFPGNPGQAIAGNVVNDGQWHQVVSTWNNGTTTLFEDGSQINQRTLIGETQILSISPNYDIGIYRFNTDVCPHHCFGENATSNIDDVRIYNRALTASEISELYRMNTSSSVDVSGYLTSAP